MNNVIYNFHTCSDIIIINDPTGNAKHKSKTGFVTKINTMQTDVFVSWLLKNILWIQLDLAW